MVVGVDVGGTFTDAIAVAADGRWQTAKVSTDREAPAQGVWRAAEQTFTALGCRPDNIAKFVHGTTVATNALVERRGARVGLLMTEGFEDTLAIGRCKRPYNYDLWFDEPTPEFLAPGRRRRPVVERVDYRGRVLKPLDEEQVRAAAAYLVEREAVDAIAVCLLFSFANDSHERRVREILVSQYPALSVSLSSEVDPEIREYERLCVTMVDAYVRAALEAYLEELCALLREKQVQCGLQVMESGGGVVSATKVIARPSRAILSGPAAGVVGAIHVAAETVTPNLLSIDIGGTSCDASIAIEGKPLIARDGEITNFPLRVAMVDITTIGAGGGSLAWFDNAGGLHVGPQSSGASPGPACYGKGNVAATATDASVVLGYISSESFAGGAVQIFPELAEEAVGQVAERLGVSIPEAAWGIHQILNAGMTTQIRLISVGRGHDPRKCALVALGGAGPVHACALAAQIGIPSVIVPATPGVLCAYGLLSAPVEHEEVSSFVATLPKIAQDAETSERLRRLLARHDEKGRESLRREGIDLGVVVAEVSLELRYVGQAHELSVTLADWVLALDETAVERAFEARHEEVYGHIRAGHPVELVNVRTVHRAWLDRDTELRTQAGTISGQPAPKGSRPVYFARAVATETPVYERRLLSVGSSLTGPVIIDQDDTTTVVPPLWGAVVVAGGNLVLSRG